MRIKELENIGIIREVHIIRKKNLHTICEVSLYIDCDDIIFKLRSLLNKEVCIEDEQRIYMRGVISDVDCVSAYTGSYVRIVISSLSKKLDKEIKYRIFQDDKKKFKDVIAFYSKGGNNIQITDSEFANREKSEPLVQDGVTDFEFLKQLSNNEGYDLYVVDTERTPCVNICKYNKYSNGRLVEKNTQTYKFCKSECSEKLCITSTDYLEFGQLVDYEGTQYVVASVQILYKDGFNSYEYLLEKNDENILKQNFTGCLGEAVVVDNNDPERKGRIQVEFANYEDIMKDNKIWIPYLLNITEQSQGSMIIPEKEETVSVFCKNGKCYSDGCIRKVAYNEKMSDPDKRIFMFKDKFLMIDNEKIYFEAFDNKINIDNESIIITKENDKLKIEKNNIYLQVGNSKIKVDNSFVQVQTSDEIGLKSGKINIDGSGKISAKAPTFDVG